MTTLITARRALLGFLAAAATVVQLGGPVAVASAAVPVDVEASSVTYERVPGGPAHRIDRTGDGDGAPGPSDSSIETAERTQAVGAGVASGPAPTGDVRVDPGELTQELLAAQPEGTRFVIGAGVHRLAKPLVPRAGQQLLGEGGAVLSGAVPVAGWSERGGHWTATTDLVRLPTASPSGTACVEEAPLCLQSESVRLDGTALRRVGSAEEARPGFAYVDERAGTIVIGDDPVGREVEISRTATAFDRGGEGVVLRNLVIEGFGSAAQDAAVVTGRGWVLENLEIRGNHGVGVDLLTRSVLRKSLVHHQGQLGVKAVGEDVLIEDNEIAHNNTAGFNAGWEAGGSKFVFTRGLIVRDNWVHHNKGPGLWTDIDNVDTLYEGNLVEANERAGIFHEVSFAAVIRDNLVRGNGTRWNSWRVEGAGILVANSSDVEVTGNVVADNATGIVLRHDDRGGSAVGPWEVARVRVTGNEVAMSEGFSGLVTTNDDATRYDDGNVFSGNTYHVAGDASFQWSGRQLDFLDWQAAGNDLTGVLR